MPGATLLPGFRPHVANIQGVRTLYYVGGEGEPLVLVHGLGGAAVNFTERWHHCLPGAEAIEQFLDGVREVDELPLEAELLGQLRRERTDA